MNVVVNAGLKSIVIGCAALLSACGVHLHRPENATLAKNAKTIYTEKVDLLSLVATERANLVKMRDAETAAMRLSLVQQRDQIFLNAATVRSPKERLERVALPRAGDPPEAQIDCARIAKGMDAALKRGDPGLQPPYVARRACALNASDRDALAALASAVANPARVAERRSLADEQRADLKTLGWVDVPACAALPEALPDEVVKKISVEKQSIAARTLDGLRDNCAVIGLPEAVPGMKGDLARLGDLQKQKGQIAAGEAEIDAEIKALAARLNDIASGTPKPADDTREKIAKAAAALRGAIAGLQDTAKSLGKADKLADLQLDSATLFLSAAEGTAIKDEDLKGKSPEESEALRRAVIVAGSVPQIAEEMRIASAALRTPSKSSLLMAQRQALIDKENITARKQLIDRRIALVERRIGAVGEEAHHLSFATIQAAEHAECTAKAGQAATNERKKAEKACSERLNERMLVAYNYVSRSLLTSRAAGDAAEVELAYTGYEQTLLANEYALKSWDNLIGTPVALLDGYHSGGIKPESLADLISKVGALIPLGIIAGKVD